MPVEKPIPRHTDLVKAYLPNGYLRDMRRDPLRGDTRFGFMVGRNCSFAPNRAGLYFTGTLIPNPDGISHPVFRPYDDQAWMFMAVLDYMKTREENKTRNVIIANDRRNFPESDRNVETSALTHSQYVMRDLLRIKLPLSPIYRFRCYWKAVTARNLPPIETARPHDMVTGLIETVTKLPEPGLNKIAMAQINFGVDTMFFGSKVPMTYHNETNEGHILHNGSFIMGKNNAGMFIPTPGQTVTL